jgi:hypothetical protein
LEKKQKNNNCRKASIAMFVFPAPVGAQTNIFSEEFSIDLKKKAAIFYENRPETLAQAKQITLTDVIFPLLDRHFVLLIFSRCLLFKTIETSKKRSLCPVL